MTDDSVSSYANIGLNYLKPTGAYMETLELPSVEEQEETLPELPPVNFVEQEIDLAAFRLW